MGLSATTIGVIGGLVLALFSFFTIGSVISKMVRAGTDINSRVLAILDLVRKADLIILPLIGGFIGYSGALDGIV